MENVRLSPLITETDLQKRVRELGEVLNKDYRDKPLTAIAILKGSFLFYADLVRLIDTDMTCDYLGVSSYRGTQSTGDVRVNLDLSRPIRDRHILIVEDIVDTGITLNFLKRHLAAHKPASVTSVSLLMKPDALKEPCEVDHVGFKIPNDFVVGYGLDYQGRFRNLPYIAQVSNLN